MSNKGCFPFLNLEHLTTFKESMINQLSNLINRYRSAVKILYSSAKSSESRKYLKFSSQDELFTEETLAPDAWKIALDKKLCANLLYFNLLLQSRSSLAWNSKSMIVMKLNWWGLLEIGQKLSTVAVRLSFLPSIIGVRLQQSCLHLKVSKLLPLVLTYDYHFLSIHLSYHWSLDSVCSLKMKSNNTPYILYSEMVG